MAWLRGLDSDLIPLQRLKGDLSTKPPFSSEADLGMGQNETTNGPQVLVLGCIYPGFILGYPIFDPQPFEGRVEAKQVTFILPQTSGDSLLQEIRKVRVACVGFVGFPQFFSSSGAVSEGTLWSCKAPFVWFPLSLFGLG